MEQTDFTLRQVAALVPCHTYSLRKRIKERPTTCPPAVFDERAQRWFFPGKELEAWLAERDRQRRVLNKPHLRFTDDVTEVQRGPFAGVFDVVEEQQLAAAERQVEEAAARQLYRHFKKERPGASDEDIARYVVAMVVAARDVEAV